jgi:hypothetical protein
VTSYGTVAGFVLSLSGPSGWNWPATACCGEYAMKFHWSSTIFIRVAERVLDRLCG